MTSPARRLTHAQFRFTAVATAILLLAAVLRLLALADVPPGLSQDEVLNADIVAAIRAGQHALFFRQGYGHEPLYHYWSVPFQILLGDNVLSIRLPAVFLGLLLVAATMRWARRDFGPVTAAAAGLGLAVSWWPIIFSRIGIRPILEPLLLVGAAWFWPRPQAGWSRALPTGLLLGLSLYTYTGAQMIFVWPLLFTAVQLITTAAGPVRRRQLGHGVVILAVAALVALPLYLTWRADPSLLQRVDQLEGPLVAMRNGEGGPLLAAALLTLGVFSFTGDPRWTYSLPGRPLFDPLTSLLFYAGLGLSFWRGRQFAYALTLTWLAAGLLPSMLTPQAPSTIRLLGAAPAVYTLAGAGVAALIHWAGQKTGGWQAKPPGWGVGAVLLFVLLLNVGRTVRDGFRAWPQAVETRLHHYQTTLLEMARYRQAHPTSFLVVTDPFFEPIDADSFRRNLGQDVNARWLQAGPGAAGALIFPADGGDGRVYVPEYAPLPPALAGYLAMPAEPVYTSPGRPAFAVYALPSPPHIPPLAEPVTFGGLITLEGYEFLPTTHKGILTVATRWQVEAPLPWNLTFFTHLLDPAGGVAAQFDGFEAAAHTLQPGDVVVQLLTLPLPDGQEPYTLVVGLYTPHDNRRLTHPGQPGDQVILAPEISFDGN